MRISLECGLAVGLWVVGCGSSGGASGVASSPTDAGARLSADGDVYGDATSKDGCSSAPLTSAPAQWVRPADCGGVGNLCSEGCGSAGCQLFGQVCEPVSGVGASPTSCAPYCLAYDCMTFDEASCFCTGDAGAQYSACACGPAAVAGLCAAEGASCATAPCCDCQGLRCVTDSVSGTVCRQPCSQNGDCASGCCNASTGVCHDSIYCNCVDAGATCAGSGPSCCPGTTCLSFSGDGGPYACYETCTENSDCATGCCNTSSGVCQDSNFCACLAAGAACTGGAPACCSGTTCAGFVPDGGGPYACYENCASQSDCSSGCCSLPLQGETYGVCGPCS